MIKLMFRLIFALLLSVSLLKATDNFQAWGTVFPYDELSKAAIKIQITWYNQGVALSDRIAVYRDGILQPTLKNDVRIGSSNYGVFYQYIPNKDAIYTYQICIIRTGECSVPVIIEID